MLMETLECCQLLNYLCQVHYLLSELGRHVVVEDFTEGNSRLSQIKPETRCTESTHDLEREIEKAHPNLFSSQIITLPLPHVSLFANEKKNLLCAVA